MLYFAHRDLRIAIYSLIFFQLAALTFFTEQSAAQDSSGAALGPIELRDQHPLALLHSTFRPQDAFILDPGTFRIGSNFSWSNTFNYKPENYRIDTETRVADIFVRYGITPGLEFQLSQNIVWRGGGDSDGLISDFHKTFLIPKSKSELLPKNQYAIEGVNKDGSTFQLGRQGTGLSGMETSLKYSPSDPFDEERWALLFGLGLPTGTADFGQDGIDAQLGVYGQAGVGSLKFYTGAAVFYYSDTNIDNLNFPAWNYSAFLGTLFPLTSRVSFYGAANVASFLLKNVDGYPDLQTYVDSGLRTRIAGNYVLDLNVRENVFHSQGTTDITLMVGLTYQFDQ